jgi:ribosome-associated toxin RatA of RatAB toxin-antitoxin module
MESPTPSRAAACGKVGFGSITLVCLLLFVWGCPSKYSVSTTDQPQFKGEINRHSRLIRSQRQRLFQILTHEDRFRAICPKGTIVTFQSPLPYGPGTCVNTTIDHIFKLTWRSRVTEVIADERIRLEFLDGFFAGGTETWQLEAEHGATRITHTIMIQPLGFLKKLAWRLKVRRKHDRMVEALFDNLQQVAEAHKN